MSLLLLYLAPSVLVLIAGAARAASRRCESRPALAVARVRSRRDARRG